MISKVRELKSHIMLGLLVVILLLGQAAPVIGQSSNTADHVVINEVDINPPGDDAKQVSEWVELYNPTDAAIDIGGWSVGATSGTKVAYKISEGTQIKSGGFTVFAFGPLWFPDTSSQIQLKSKNSTIVDSTPILRDIENDLKSWQRNTDGLNTGSATDWVFRTSNAGSSNGRISVTAANDFLSIQLSTDKSVYAFGDVVKISGEVSKKVTLTNEYTSPQVYLTIKGPENFKKSFLLFPDSMNMFYTEMKTDKVLQVPAGDYKVVAEYGGQTKETSFTISEEAVAPTEQESSQVISIAVDKPIYIPGETAVLSGNTTKIIPLTGMKFKIFDPNGKQVFDGSLYPDTNGKFKTTFFMNSVNPVFGTYTIAATYGTETTRYSYQLVEEIKEDRLITLVTDKQVYGLGETVIISGRSNKVWISSLDIDIVQSFINKDVTDTFDVKDSVRLAGDGTFKYEFKIPAETDRLGDYKVIVSKDIGSEETSFKVVENPSEFVETISRPLLISTDKDTYGFGEQLVILGKVQEKKDLGRTYVQVSITKADGTPIISKGDPRASAAKNQDTAFSFTGIPDSSGNFEIKTSIMRNIFEKGEYLIKAKYAEISASTSFTVSDSLDLSGGVKILASTDKEVYGVGEQVKLTGGVSTFTAQPSYTLTMTDPNGKTTQGGVTLDNGQFSWTWTVPSRATVFGLYKLTIRSDSDKTDVFFKVSKNPESETALPPIIVETDKSAYSTGESVIVSGTVLTKGSTQEGSVVDLKPTIIVKSPANKEIFKATPDLDLNGKFETSLKLVAGGFKTGQYKVSAKYSDARAQTVFKVVDKFNVGKETPLVLLMQTDKEKYLQGDTVKISGKTSKVISLFDVDVKIIEDEELISKTAVRFDPDGSFNFDYTIPKNANLGNYTVEANTAFDTTTVMYEVVNELPPEIILPPTEIPTNGTTTGTGEPTPTPKKLTDIVNRISDSLVSISIQPKNIEEKTYLPTLFEGLLRVNSGDESDVNLRITSNDGTCLIGPDDDCQVTQSTRDGSSLYQIVQVGDTSLKVRYSGTDTKLEKFTILPESQGETIPQGDWTVEILKDNQVSRFYYKISYTSIE